MVLILIRSLHTSHSCLFRKFKGRVDRKIVVTMFDVPIIEICLQEGTIIN